MIKNLSLALFILLVCVTGTAYSSPWGCLVNWEHSHSQYNKYFTYRNTFIAVMSYGYAITPGQASLSSAQKTEIRKAPASCGCTISPKSAIPGNVATGTCWTIFSHRT